MEWKTTSIKCGGCGKTILPDKDGKFSCKPCGVHYPEEKRMNEKWFNDVQANIASLRQKAESTGLTRGELTKLIGMMEVLELQVEQTIEKFPERAEQGKQHLKSLQDGRKELVSYLK